MPVKKLQPKRTNVVAQVPDASIGAKYKSREVFPGVTEFELFSKATENGMNILIEGPTGAGKTMAAQAYAAMNSLPFYAVPCNAGVDPQEMIGQFVPDPDTGHWEFVPGGIYDVIAHGGVLLINEINFLPDRVAAIIFEVLDSRRSVTLKHAKGNQVARAHRPGGCWCALSEADCRSKWPLIIADMNPGYQGTRDLNTALRNRFSVVLDWDYDTEVEEKLVESKTMLTLAARIRKETKEEFKYSEPVSTNRLIEFDTMATLFGVKAASDNFAAQFVRPEERESIRTLLLQVQGNLNNEYKRIIARRTGQLVDPLELQPDPVEVQREGTVYEDRDWLANTKWW